MAGLFDGHRRFLNMMNVTTIPLYCLITGVIIHISLLFVFINQYHLGIQGLGYAASIANTMVYVSVMIFGFFDP
jgi:Na+-driven multidrug efflux pump